MNGDSVATHIVTSEEKQRLLSFLGYGRLDAPVWFLGMEEAGGGEDNLRVRSTFDQVEDLQEAHIKLGITHHHEGKRRIQPTWNMMCEFMLRIEGNISPTTEDRRAYQGDELDRVHGDSLILEFLPIPKPKTSSWDYPLTFPEYPDVEVYRREQTPPRIALLSQLVVNHRPRIIVAYGKANWPYYRQILSEGEYSERNGFETGVQGDTLMILTHFLSRKEMNGRHAALANTAREWMNAMDMKESAQEGRR